MEMTRGLWIFLIIAVILFCVAAKSGWDQEIATPVCTFIYAATLALGYIMGIGAKYGKILFSGWTS